MTEVTEIQSLDPEIPVKESLLSYLFTRIEQLKAQNASLKAALVPTLTREA